MDSKRDIKNKIWLSRWYRLRKLGFLRYSLQYGCLYFGLTLTICFLMLSSIMGETISSIFVFSNLPVNILLAISSGVMISIINWIINELRFRRLGAKYPSALQYF